jgi:hypothetical protein
MVSKRQLPNAPKPRWGKDGPGTAQAVTLKEDSLGLQRDPNVPVIPDDVLESRKELIDRDLHEGHMDAIAQAGEGAAVWMHISLPTCPPDVRPSVWIWSWCVLEMQRWMRDNQTTSTGKASKALGWSTDMYYNALKHPDVAGVLAVWGDAAMEMAVGHVRDQFYRVAEAQVAIAQDVDNSKSTQAARWCSELLKYHNIRQQQKQAGSISGPGATRLQEIMKSFNITLEEETTTRRVVISEEEPPLTIEHAPPGD